MAAESAIPAAVVAAYLETEYRVSSDTPFILRIGVASAALAAAHARHHTDCSAFVTACNPFSQLLNECRNAERQAALRNEISAHSWTFTEGTGQHPGNAWPAEASFLIFGLPLETTKTLGTRWQQNAI